MQIGTTINLGLIPNPSFYPIQSRSTTMEVFQTTVERELTKLDSISRDPIQHNLSYKERIALKSLNENPYIVIHPSDKGGSMVVMDSGLYEKFIGNAVG